MDTKHKFQLGYSKTRECIREARSRQQKKFTLGWISKEFDFYVTAKEGDYGLELFIGTSDLAIEDAVVRTMLTRYGYG